VMMAPAMRLGFASTLAGAEAASEVANHHLKLRGIPTRGEAMIAPA